MLAAAFIPAAVVTWGLHEFAHWAMGTALGYDMWMTFNKAGLIRGQEYASAWHQGLVGIAGPAITVLQGVLAFVWVRKSGKLWTYAFLFLTFWMRLIAMCISFFVNPNDEAEVGLMLGLPMWILPTVIVLGLLTLTYMGSRRLNVGWKGNMLAYAMASFVTAVIVFSDAYLFAP